MTKMYPTMIFVAVLIATVSSSSIFANTSELTSHKIKVDRLTRSYLLYTPEYAQSQKKRPLVIVLHGGGKGGGRAAAKMLGFSNLADQHNFIVAYPNGIKGHWNDGRGVSYHGESDKAVDDVAFISKLIDTLIKSHKIDEQHVYVAGISNGGMMTLRLACDISERLAAVAAITANIPQKIINRCQPKQSLSVLIMNGTKDPIVPWEGGNVRFFGREMGALVSTQETIDFWLKHNHITSPAERTRLPNKDRKDWSTVMRKVYTNPQTQTEVVSYKIVKGGHTLPGSDIPDRPLLLGRKNNDIDGAGEIWRFFSRQENH